MRRQKDLLREQRDTEDDKQKCNPEAKESEEQETGGGRQADTDVSLRGMRTQHGQSIPSLQERGLACRQTFRVDGWTHPSMALVRYSLSTRSPTAGIPHLLDQLGVLLGKGYSS